MIDLMNLFAVPHRSLHCTTSITVRFHGSSVPVQDFPVSVPLIWTQWRAGKMDADTCLSELIRCRDPRSPQSITALELIVRKEKMLNLKQDIRRVQCSLSQQQRPFIEHPLIQEWMQQYSVENYGKTSRLRFLLWLEAANRERPARVSPCSGSSTLSNSGVNLFPKVCCPQWPALIDNVIRLCVSTSVAQTKS